MHLFGDGATGSGLVVSHNYAQAGSYTARLTVTDKDGAQATDTATVQINATNQAPLAVITAPANGKVDESLAFSGSNSRDNDGSIVTYAWNFGDGATASGVEVSHSYSAFGTYQVTLTVVDNDGLAAQATQAVIIDELVQLELPPNVTLTAPSIGLVDENLTFNASGSSDPDGQIVDYTWNFGDGIIQSGMFITTTHSYSQSGLYTATLTITDNDSLINTTAQQVIIQ